MEAARGDVATPGECTVFYIRSCTEVREVSLLCRAAQGMKSSGRDNPPGTIGVASNRCQIIPPTTSDGADDDDYVDDAGVGGGDDD